MFCPMINTTKYLFQNYITFEISINVIKHNPILSNEISLPVPDYTPVDIKYFPLCKRLSKVNWDLITFTESTHAKK